MMETLKFSYNWNNKLECKAFTTIRKSWRYQVGDIVKVELHNKGNLYPELAFEAEIIDRRPLRLEHINDWIAQLDTGYSADECRQILQRMYKNDDWSKPLCWYLLKRIEK